jgi:hypothetical protein
MAGKLETFLLTAGTFDTSWDSKKAHAAELDSLASRMTDRVDAPTTYGHVYETSLGGRLRVERPVYGPRPR